MLPQFNYYLKDIKSTTPTLIYLQAKYNCFERLTLTTGEKILPTHWDFKNKRAITKFDKIDYPSINDWLDKMEIEAKDFFRNCKFQGKIPSALEIKSHLEQKFNLNPKPVVIIPVKKQLTVIEFIESYIKTEVNNKSVETIKVYTSTKNHLVAFLKSTCRNDIAFDDINESFYNGFIQYQNNLKLARNTLGKNIKVLKTFLSAATERGINSNYFFKSKIFKKPLEDVDKIYLRDDEIQRISGLDLKKEKSLDVTRDLFIIACYTGFRFSDFTTLSKEHISDDFITKKTFKTKSKVVLPIHPVVKDILKKYNYVLPKANCNSHLNRNLKEIAKRAKIFDDVEIVKTIGGKTVSQKYEKWELVCSHTGRRSFATNAYLAGVPAISIMKLTSHKSEAVFLKYVCISEIENAEHIQSHTFFNRKNFDTAA